jgi:hypothetical protein
MVKKTKREQRAVALTSAKRRASGEARETKRNEMKRRAASGWTFFTSHRKDQFFD